MYIYGFYSFDCGDTVFFKLGHEKKFTKEEFEHITNKCRKNIENKLQTNLKRIDTLDDDEQIDQTELKQLRDLCCETQIKKNIFTMLINEYGFSNLEPIYVFTFADGKFGMPSTIINACK